MSRKKKWHKVKKVVPISDLQKIPPGPLRHKQGLSPLLTAIARELFQRVGHYVHPSFEQWELGFMRDKHPWWEVLRWEAICRAYEAYLAKHPETTDHKWIVGMLGGIAIGVFWQGNEPEQISELRQLFEEARRQRWTPLLRTVIDFP